jgi:phosphoserine phosphatase
VDGRHNQHPSPIRSHREHISNLIASATYNPGVADVLPSIDRSKYEIVLISGGFRELAARVQRDFVIKHAFAACEYLFGDSGLLLSWNLGCTPKVRHGN